jgi:hypothetical protein
MSAPSRRRIMADWLPLILLVGYAVLMGWVLPKFGINT